MFVYYLLYTLGLGGVTVSFVQDRKWRHAHRKLYLPMLLGCLLAVAAFRSSSSDRDYLNYLQWFDLIAAGGLGWIGWVKDPAFVFVSQVVLKFGLNYIGALFVFITLALLGKFCFLRMATDERWLTLVLYLLLCRFFLEQEMTAIRAAVAIPLMSISLLLAFRRKTVLAIALFLAALVFHISALIVLPVLISIIAGVRFESRGWIVSLIPVAIIAYVLLPRLMGGAAGFFRLDPYLDDPDAVHLNVLLSVYFWGRVCVLGFIFLKYWKTLLPEHRLAACCCALGICAQVALSSNGALAFRTAALFGLFDLVLFTIPLRYLQRASAVGYLIFLLLFGAVVFGSQLRIMPPYGWIFA